MSRLAAVLWIFSAALIAVVLFVLKYEVQRLERELQMVSRQIVVDQQAVHVLNAEWSYLNRPARIADLAARHLRLQPLSTAQIVEIEAVPTRPVPGVKPQPPRKLVNAERLQ